MYVILYICICISYNIRSLTLEVLVIVIRLSLKMFYLLKQKEKRPLRASRVSREGRGLFSEGERRGREGLFEIQSDLVAIVGNNQEESLVFT